MTKAKKKDAITAAAVREKRLVAGLTQREAADLVGMDVSNWERIEGGTRNIRPRTWVLFLDRLAERAAWTMVGARVDLIEDELRKLREALEKMADLGIVSPTVVSLDPRGVKLRAVIDRTSGR
jgi:transcriptional regulator with XRE-family HTH domain